MFEKATRLKLRWETQRGNVSVEDLWDLPLLSDKGPSLDSLAIAQNKALKETEDESFIKPKTVKTSELKLKLDILVHIINVKLAEQKAAEDRAAKAAKKKAIMEIIADKEHESLRSASVDELKSMLNEL